MSTSIRSTVKQNIHINSERSTLLLQKGLVNYLWLLEPLQWLRKLSNVTQEELLLAKENTSFVAKVIPIMKVFLVDILSPSHHSVARVYPTSTNNLHPREEGWARRLQGLDEWWLVYDSLRSRIPEPVTLRDGIVMVPQR